MRAFLTPDELAVRVAVSSKLVIADIERGELPAVRGCTGWLVDAWVVDVWLFPDQLPDRHLERDYSALLRRDPCCYCGAAVQPIERQVDHIVPRTHGGLNVWTNFSGACRDCNVTKAAQPLLSFLLAGLGRGDDE